MVTALAFVAAAALGAVLRYLATVAAADRWRVPVGTLAVNLAGSFVLGVVWSWDGPAATVLGVGGLGALTTFSTVTAEILDLRRDDRPALWVYVALTVVGGVLAAWTGLRIGR